MSTHSIGFCEEISKIILQLSPNIIKYTPYLFFSKWSQRITSTWSSVALLRCWDKHACAYLSDIIYMLNTLTSSFERTVTLAPTDFFFALLVDFDLILLSQVSSHFGHGR